MRRSGLAFFAACMLSVPMVAQEARIRVVEARRVELARGSLPWFDAGFELVEAQLDTEVVAAAVTAMELWDEGEQSPVDGLAATTAATMALVVTLRDGPNAAEEWLRMLPEPTPQAAAGLRARYWMARARVLCYRARHAEEMECLLTARAAVDRASDPVLWLRCVALTSHIQPERRLVELQRAFDAAVAAGRGDDVEHLRPLLHIERRSHAIDRGDLTEVLRLDEVLRDDAQRLGDRRLLGFVTANRASWHYQRKERDLALPIYHEVAAIYGKLGDRRSLFGVSNMLAWAALHRRDLATAAAQIAANRDLIEGRGFTGDEKQLLETRFELALQRRDSDLAAELKRQLDRHGIEETIEEQRCTELRSRVRLAEEAGAAAAARSAASLVAAEARLRDATTIGTVCLVVALSALVGISWRARRRLVRANRQLAEQVARVAEGQAVQAKLEERMRELENTERLGTMAAGVAHDFNNLLTGILGNAELIAQRPSDVGNADLADAVRAAATQAARLCRQLQHCAGGAAAPLQALDLATVVRDVQPALAAAAGSGCRVAVVGPAQGIGVEGDRAQLEQVLLNLVVNAVDAGARSVQLELVAPAGGRETLLVVRDDGAGMTADVRERIFDPFFTTRFPGRGLGLAVVHGVVRRHGGQIEVRSEPGAGATFTISLPSAGLPEPVVLLPRPGPDAGAPAQVTVLVVDDDDAVRNLLAHVLQRHGHEVICVGRSHELAPALQALVGAGGVVAFVDLTMPGMDGLEVAREVRLRRADAAIVLMSGHPPEYVEQVAGSLRPDRVLAKPFTTSAIADLVAELGVRARGVAAEGVA